MFCVSSDGKNIKFNEERARIYSKYLNDIFKKQSDICEPVKLDLTYQECQMFKKLIKYGHMPSCFITHEVTFMRRHTKIRDYLKFAKYDMLVFNIFLHIGSENPVLCEINQIPLIDRKNFKKARKLIKKLTMTNKPILPTQPKNSKFKSIDLLISFIIALHDKNIKYNFHINSTNINDFIIDLKHAIDESEETAEKRMDSFYLNNVYNGTNSPFFTVFLPSDSGLEIISMTDQNGEDRELSKIVLPPVYTKYINETVEILLELSAHSGPAPLSPSACIPHQK